MSQRSWDWSLFLEILENHKFWLCPLNYPGSSDSEDRVLSLSLNGRRLVHSGHASEGQKIRVIALTITIVIFSVRFSAQGFVDCCFGIFQHLDL